MRFLVVFFIALLAVVGYLAYLNPAPLTIRLTEGASYEIPIVALMLLSMAVGGLLVILAFGIRETQALFRNWKTTRRLKREEKIQELYAGAMNAFWGRKNKEAIALFHKILEMDPTHIGTLLCLGNLYQTEKDYGEAMRFHRKARSLDEKNVEVLMALAKDYEEAMRFEEAISTLHEVLDQEDHFPALIRVRDILMKLTRWEEAREVQEKVLKTSLPEEESHRERSILLGITYELGRVLLEKGQNEVARRQFRGAIKQDKEFLPAYIGLGEAQIQDGRPQDAVETWEKAYERTHNVTVLHFLEDLHIDMGEPDKAITMYKNAVSKRSSDTVLKFYLGRLYDRLEMVDEAFDCLLGLEVSEEEIPDLHKLLAHLYMRKGDLQEAVEECQKAMKADKWGIPYTCSSCRHQIVQWSARCPVCKNWNTCDVQSLPIPEGKVRESFPAQ